MTPEEIRKAVFRVLRRVAPESKPEQLDPTLSFRDELDLDSVDFMNVVVGLHETLGVDVPESDYGKLVTIDGCVAYLAAKLGGA
jgi:acyl carrier protein